MTKKGFLLFLFVFSLTTSSAQNKFIPGKILFKDGSRIKGYVMIAKGKVQFKTDHKSRKKKYGPKVVDKVIYGDVIEETGYYEYVPIRKGHYSLMKLNINGKVKLYSEAFVKTSHEYFDSENTKFVSSIEKKRFINYFLFKTKDEVAIKIAINDKNDYFLKLAKQYFADCPDIINYLDNDLYHINNIAELIEDYNLLCN